MRVKAVFISILLMVFISKAEGQELQVALDFDIGAPQGEFSDQLDRLGWGLSVMGGYRFGNSPVMLGLDFGFMNFGKDVRDAPLSTTIPDLRVQVENSYNLVHGHLMLRLTPPPTPVRPFVEGLFGFNYFYTETVLRERGAFSGEDKLRDTNFEDVALSYGLGAGIQFRVYRQREADRNPEETMPSSVYLGLSSRYLFGREAEYLQEGSITIENGEAFFDVSRSTTDLLYFKLGLIINF